MGKFKVEFVFDDIDCSELFSQSKELVIKKNNKYLIKSEEHREIAAIFLRDAYNIKKVINKHHEKMYNKAKETLREIKDKWNSALEDPEKVIKILSEGIGEYDALKKLQAEKKEEEEKSIIEKLRQEKAKELIDKANELKESGKIEDMQAALNLENQAEDILDAPLCVEVEKPEKLKGFREQKCVKCDIENESNLLIYLVEKIIDGYIDHFSFLKVNVSALRRHVKESGGKVSMPGLKVWEENKIISTGRKDYV